MEGGGGEFERRKAGRGGDFESGEGGRGGRWKGGKVPGEESPSAPIRSHQGSQDESINRIRESVALSTMPRAHNLILAIDKFCTCRAVYPLQCTVLGLEPGLDPLRFAPA